MREVIDTNHTIMAALLAQPDATTVEIDDNIIFWGLFSNPTLDPSLGGIDA